MIDASMSKMYNKIDIFSRLAGFLLTSERTDPDLSGSNVSERSQYRLLIYIEL